MRALVALCGALVLGGCAVRPLPEQITTYRTTEIVRKIRCEARDAIKSKVVSLLTDERAPEQTRAIGLALRNGEIPFAGFDYRRLDPRTRASVETYEKSAIAYEFTFEISETNNLSGSVGILDPFSNGLARIGVAAGADRRRLNTRNFRVSDSFGGLVDMVHDSYCAGVAGGPNLAYPITGEIGLAEVIETFIDLNQSGNLVGDNSLVPTLADSIEFQTIVTGSVNPTIALSPLGGNVGRSLRLAEAGIFASASRIDNHKLRVALSLPQSGPAERARGARGAATENREGAPVPGGGRSSAEMRALRELDRQDEKGFFSDTRRLRRLAD